MPALQDGLAWYAELLIEQEPDLAGIGCIYTGAG